jgi:GntR family transcriptional regulator
MQIHVSPNDGAPIYQQIVNQVRYLAASGRLLAGDRLPPVRKLAEQILVNPNTVARAYRELEAAGVIASRQGSGSFITSKVSPLSHRERNRILNERIDMLLAEAAQMDIELETVVRFLRERARRMGMEAERTETNSSQSSA